MKGIWQTAGALLVALALVAAPVAADDGVIQVRGEVIGYDEMADPVIEVLPDGRILLYDASTLECYLVEAREGPDYVSGCYVIELWGLIQPSGTMQMWGNAHSVDLDFWEGDDEGHWAGTFRGAAAFRGGLSNVQVSIENQGYDALAGWAMRSKEMWKEYGARGAFFFGHVVPPEE